MPWAAAAVVGGALIGASSANSAAKKQQQAANAAIDQQNNQLNTSRADLAPYRQAGAASLARLQQLLGISSRPEAPTRDQFWSTPGSNEHKLSIIDPAGILKRDNRSTADRFDPGNLLHKKKNSSPDPVFDQAGFDAAQQKYQQDLNDYNSSKTSPEYGSLLRKFSQSDLQSDPVYNSGLQFGLSEGEKAINNRAASAGGYDSGATLKALTRFGNDYGSTKAEGAYNRYNTDQSNIFNRLSGLAGTGQQETNILSQLGAGNSSNISNILTSNGNAQAAAQIAKGNALSGALNNYSDYSMLKQLSSGGQRSNTAYPTGSGTTGTTDSGYTINYN